MTDPISPELSKGLEANQQKPSFSTIRNTHRVNREEVKKMFERRHMPANENKGVIADVSKLTTRKELEGDIDKLTGLPNKNGFNKRLAEAVKIAQRDEKELYGVVFDADGLKGINDTQGHAEGDRFIATIGELFTKGIRSGDFIGRTGGDEFIAILKNPGEEGVEAWWKRQNDLFTHAGIRISGGAVPIDLSDVSGSLELADQAMYAAKLDKANTKNNFTLLNKESIIEFKNYANKQKQKAA